MSFAPKIALTRATPSALLPERDKILSLLIPPMATTGTGTAWQMSRRVSKERGRASALVDVENIAPTPR